jgi:hypothetical protein
VIETAEKEMASYHQVSVDRVKVIVDAQTYFSKSTVGLKVYII